jgi:pimeloyl-ACP methyl ester carboxylesterase
MRRLLLVACLASLSGCSLDSFLFSPKQEDYAFSTAIVPAANQKVYTLAVAGRKVYGVHAFHEPPARGKVLYFHGNYQSLNHYFKWIEIYWEMGYDVFCVDYEGFGKSEGSPSEDALIRDADAALQFVTSDLAWGPGEVIIYGYSLGSIPAVDLSARQACRLLFLEAPIGNADTTVDGASPLDIPSAFVIVKHFDNIERITASRNPLIVIQGTADRTLPWQENGKRVYDAANVQKRCRWLEHAGHGDIPKDIGRENYKALLAELIAGW